MKAKIEIDINIDGDVPSNDSILGALWKITGKVGYIGSEQVDGTDNWGLEIGKIEIELDEQEI